jgi:hypothetical protein
LQVANLDGGTLSYSISVDANWLSCSPLSGTSTGEQDTIIVSYMTSGLAVGAYSATITIVATGASNTPRTIPVSLTVNDATSTGDIGDVRGWSCFIETTRQETVNGVAIALLLVLGGAVVLVVARPRNAP